MRLMVWCGLYVEEFAKGAANDSAPYDPERLFLHKIRCTFKATSYFRKISCDWLACLCFSTSFFPNYLSKILVKSAPKTGQHYLQEDGCTHAHIPDGHCLSGPKGTLVGIGGVCLCVFIQALFSHNFKVKDTFYGIRKIILWWSVKTVCSWFIYLNLLHSLGYHICEILSNTDNFSSLTRHTPFSFGCISCPLILRTVVDGRAIKWNQQALLVAVVSHGKFFFFLFCINPDCL